MNQAIFCFYADLNIFLADERKNRPFTHHFKEHPSIKDMIASFGVPHPEVHGIIVNGIPVDFSYLVQNNDQCHIYPISYSIENAQFLPLRPEPEPRFVLDLHLGKLAAYLRRMGFDTLYRNDYPDEELADVSSQENRILLTRDIGLLKRKIVTHGYWVRNTDPERQLREVLQRFNLFDGIKPFSRCIHCNGSVKAVDKETIAQQIPPKTKESHDEFRQCLDCGKIYWKGSHYEKMLQFIAEVRADRPAGF
ncbi:MULTISPECIES: Mut7-C RNAse domain-containing protein [Planktothricoides]|uniref:Mut7-C RNAse domain-containing protein n=2 Tax=Planktothricoides raciborskii TaxID=132608 RepID=A0AAU8JGC7_9CYAN|nr:MULTISPECIES: Mut7-C RNAse domain-containing protein [Planktothricoides]KOR36974.1 twitching motility protein PilT [Planktothricoides sp. SR001]MBD2545321.1 twitching motility protein PilT [Planktothricoides raciborskii FACHB-1370]MBD2584387.1 twitching motility protein PilT [Planktothricoides raciborskii FACHB-1261]